MRTEITVLMFCLALVGAYIVFSHIAIYRAIGNAGLRFPYVESEYWFRENGGSSLRTYVALGDSLTAGVGVSKYEESYPYRVASKLSKKDSIRLKIHAYPGDRTSNIIRSHLTPAIEDNPEIVTLLIGTNDMHGKVSLSVFEKNYRTILDRLTRETKAKIYVLSIPFLGSNSLLWPPHNFYYDNRTQTFNAVIQGLAREYNVVYIDIASPTKEEFKKDGALYAADSFHPSVLGYTLWANLIYENIRQ